MKSPFPGMDPYLERHWGDVHHSLIQYSRDALQARLPEDLRARVEERLVVEKDEFRGRRIVPDVAILERESWRGAGASEECGLAVAEPLVIEMEDVEVTEGFIEIRETGEGGRLVTAIEFLSPANKPGGDGSKKYLRKQKEVLGARASLVEIDLVRAGRYTLAAPEDRVPEAMRDDYLACITLADDGYRRHELYHLPLRQRLPDLPIPLRQDDPRIPLGLAALLAHAYEAGRYHTLDYSAPLVPPLTGDHAAWAEARLSEAKQG